MSVRSRIDALERAARRRQERGYPMTAVMPKLRFDMSDSETREVLARWAELRQRAASDHPIDTARLVLEDAEFAGRARRVIDRALAASPVHQTGNVKA